MKTHCLVVRRGVVGILCNGRSAITVSGKQANKYKGDAMDILNLIQETTTTNKIVLIPEDRLVHGVTCSRCKCLSEPGTRSRLMRKIYTKSSLWKNRAGKKAHTVLETIKGNQASEEKTSQRIEISPEKTCILTIHVV